MHRQYVHLSQHPTGLRIGQQTQGNVVGFNPNVMWGSDLCWNTPFTWNSLMNLPSIARRAQHDYGAQ